MPTQAQLYYQAVRDAAVVNEDFLFLVRNGLTREDLQQNIQRRPSLWSRFAGWVDKLPSRDANRVAAESHAAAAI